MPSTSTPRKRTRTKKVKEQQEGILLTHDQMMNWVTTLNDLSISQIIDESKTTMLNNDPVMKNLFDEGELFILKGKIFTLLEWIKISNGNGTNIKTQEET